MSTVKVAVVCSCIFFFVLVGFFGFRGNLSFGRDIGAVGGGDEHFVRADGRFVTDEVDVEDLGGDTVGPVVVFERQADAIRVTVIEQILIQSNLAARPAI